MNDEARGAVVRVDIIEDDGQYNFIYASNGDVIVIEPDGEKRELESPFTDKGKESIDEASKQLCGASFALLKLIRLAKEMWEKEEEEAKRTLQ